MIVHDAHCHLDSLTNIDATQNLAVAAILPNDIIKLSEIRKDYPNIKIGIGLHPWYINPNYNLELLEKDLTGLIEKYQPDFIGECGLDKLKPHYKLQKSITELHCKLAQRYALPIVLHCVRSYNELLQILTKYPVNKGLLHAYNANNDTAKQLAKKNIYLGIGSILMNENSQIYKSIVNTPLQQLVIESDAPYMALDKISNSSSEDCRIYFNQLCNLKKISSTDAVELINRNWTNLYS